MKHFLFEAGVWNGSGVVQLSHSSETLSFTTQWKIEPQFGMDAYLVYQQVQIDGISECMTNRYEVDASKQGEFALMLFNDALGSYRGQGVFNDTKIAWEFAHPGKLDGLEVYERIADDAYAFSSTYTGGDGFLTKITGTIQKQK